MINIILSTISGMLLILIFPKANMYILAYIALVPLLISLKRAGSRNEAALYGFISGIVFFGGYLFWINILSRWALFWANIAWISLVIFQAFYIAGFAFIYKMVHKRSKRYIYICAPVIWVLFEWIRALGPYGVTGGGLGYSQADFLPILQLAGIFGVYGIAFLVVMFNEAISVYLSEKNARPLFLSGAIFILVLLYGSNRIAQYKDTGRQIKVAIVQANIPQDIKLDYRLANDIGMIHEKLSRKTLKYRPNIVIWPETAVTNYLFETEMIWDVKRLIAEGRAAYIIGTPFRDRDKIYNSVVAFSGKGEYLGRYDKQRLVPFGEYLPFRFIFYPMLGNNALFAEDYNSNQKPRILDIGLAKVGVVICFESTFPYMVKNRVRKGAQFILIATNDAWFFNSAAIYQHLQAAKLRAVENNIYVVQSANTGVSAIIDPLGRIVEQIPQGKAGILTGNIYITERIYKE